MGIGHFDPLRKIRVLDAIVSQTGRAPFNPRNAVRKFAETLKEYRVSRVTGDACAGETFRADFQEPGITYTPCGVAKSDLYEKLEVLLNAGEVELLDVAVLQEQLLTLIWRGNRIDHQPGDHDDYANAAAGVIVAFKGEKAPVPWGVMAAALEARSRQNIGFF